MSRHAKVVRNVLALLINQVGTWTVTLVTILIVPPYLGPRLYGSLAFIGSYVGFFGLVMVLGTGTYLTWRIAREPEQASKLTLNTLTMQVPICLLWGGIALGALPLIDRDPLLFRLAMITVASTVLGVFSGTGAAALAGLQHMRVPAFLSLVASMFSSALAIGAVLLHKGVLIIAGSSLAVQVAATIVMLAYTHSKIPLRSRVQPRLWYTILAGGMPFFAWSAVLLFYWQIDIPLLKVMAGDTTIAWYSVANRISGIAIFVPTIITAAILPALSKEQDPKSPHFRSLASRSIRAVSAVNIPAAVGTILLASSALSILHYPASFNQAEPLIVILALNLPLVALDMVLGTILIAMGKQKAWVCVGVVAAIVNPIANLWAIPATEHAYGNGAIGASLTTVLSELIMFFGALYLRPRTVFTWGDVFYIGRCILAALFMVPAVWALSQHARIGIIAGVAYGMIVYAFAAYTLQVVRNDDLQKVLGIVLGRFGIASPTEFWAQLRLSFLGGRRGKRALEGVATRAGVVVSRPLIFLGRRLSEHSLGVPSVQHQAAPVRYGSPVHMNGALAGGLNGNGSGHLAAEDFTDTVPVRVPAGGLTYARHDESQYQETLIAARSGRRLPPAPPARRLRRVLAGVGSASRPLARTIQSQPRRLPQHWR